MVDVFSRGGNLPTDDGSLLPADWQTGLDAQKAFSRTTEQLFPCLRDGDTYMDQRYFAALDGVRGVAALIVVWLHLVDHGSLLSVPKGYLAVDLFFVLSGAVIANAYDHRLSAGMALRELFLIRFIRLYPLYILSSALGAITLVYANIGELTIKKVLLAIIVLPDWAKPNSAAFPLDGPTWSLFFEFWMNMFYCYFFSRLTIRVIVSLMLVSLVGITMMVAYSQAHNVDVGWTFATLPHGTFRIIFPFFAGVLLLRIYKSRPPLALIRKYSKILTTLLLVGVLVVLIGRPPSFLSGQYDLLCVIFIFPLIVWIGMQLMPSGGLFDICKMLGVLSYPIYCIHLPIITLLRLHGGLSFLDGNAWNLVSLALVVVLSFALNYSFDAPLRRWLQKRLLSKAAIAPT